MIMQEAREVTLTLREQGTTTREMLGADLKFERFTDVHQKVYRVTDIKVKSPAHNAGLDETEES